MQELSMNVLDIAQNSVRAGATEIIISLVQETKTSQQILTIEDNGCGMDAEMVTQVLDPFCTTRTTRKVGLGIPFLKMAAEQTGGNLQLESTPGKGTTVTARFTLGHIDLMPLGDMAGSIAALLQTNPDIHFRYRFTKDGTSFVLDTREVQELLDGVPLSTPAVALFLKEYIAEHMQAVVEETEAS